MAIVKTAERRIKRLWIRLLTALVRTRRVSRDEILRVPPKRILVVRQHHQMGDMLLAVPAYRAIVETFPGVELDVIAAPINRDVLSNNPYVCRVFTFRGFTRLPLLLRRIRGRRYDICIVLHTMSFSFTSALLGLLSGARYRVGSTSQPFGNRLSDAFYHLELPLPARDQLVTMNEAEHNLFPLRAMGIDTSDLSPVIVPDAKSEAWAAAYVGDRASGKAVMAVHPGAGKADNIWPPGKHATVVNGIAQHVDIRVLVIEGPRDSGTVEEFCTQLSVGYERVRGRSISDVAALLKRMSLVLCNDTGVMHVSCASGARTLAVFGPTEPVRWAPLCSNLHVVRARDGRLSSLDPETVLARALELLGEKVPSRGDSRLS